MYPIVMAPNSILAAPTKRVDFSGSRLLKIIDEMRATLLAQKDPAGVGLAANQVNLPYSLFLARFSAKRSEPIRVFVNPEVVNHSPETQPVNDEEDSSLEGCLSLPNFYGTVKRWKWVEISFQPISSDGQLGDQKIERFDNFAAVVIQHELDHLNGKIFVLKILEQNGKLYKIKGKDKKGKDIWEEVEI